MRWAENRRRPRVRAISGGAFFAAAVIAAALLPLPAGGARAEEAVHLDVVGGLAGVSQYEQLEKPFWTNRIEELSNGRIRAEIHPFDRSGLPGPEMLQLIRLGVVPFGTALLAAVAGDEPELNAADLPALNPNFAALRKTVDLYRPHLREVLHDKYGIELLAIYAYPAQVIYCTKPFSGLNDLGRAAHPNLLGRAVRNDGGPRGYARAHAVRRHDPCDSGRPDRLRRHRHMERQRGRPLRRHKLYQRHGHKLGAVVLRRQSLGLGSIAAGHARHCSARRSAGWNATYGRRRIARPRTALPATPDRRAVKRAAAGA